MLVTVINCHPSLIFEGKAEVFPNGAYNGAALKGQAPYETRVEVLVND